MNEAKKTDRLAGAPDCSPASRTTPDDGDPTRSTDARCLDSLEQWAYAKQAQMQKRIVDNKYGDAYTRDHADGYDDAMDDLLSMIKAFHETGKVLQQA